MHRQILLCLAATAAATIKIGHQPPLSQKAPVAIFVSDILSPNHRPLPFLSSPRIHPSLEGLVLGQTLGTRLQFTMADNFGPSTLTAEITNAELVGADATFLLTVDSLTCTCNGSTRIPLRATKDALHTQFNVMLAWKQENNERYIVGCTVIPSTSEQKTEVTFNLEFAQNPLDRSRVDFMLEQVQRRYSFPALAALMFILLAIPIPVLLTVSGEIKRYNMHTIFAEEHHTDYGWRQLYGDVFRSPTLHVVLGSLVGFGTNFSLFFAFFFLIRIFAGLEESNTSHALLLLSVFVSSFANGYISAVLFKMCGGMRWSPLLVISVGLLPGIAALVAIVVNGIKSIASPYSVPTLSFLSTVLIWFAVVAPIVAGSGRGIMRRKILHPLRPNHIPRQIPPQQSHLEVPLSLLYTGIAPYFVMKIALTFSNPDLLFPSEYLFWRIVMPGACAMFISSLTAIAMCYVQLSHENHKWWWPAFMHGGAIGIAVIFKSVFSFFFLESKVGQQLFNVVQDCAFGCVFAVVFGSAGFLSTLMFVRRIYQDVKIY